MTLPYSPEANDPIRADDAPGPGHNSGDMSTGPDKAVPDPFTPLKARTDTLVATANQWLGTVKTITDADTAQACDSFLSQVRAELKATDETRKAINKPWADATAANNARFATLTTLLTTAETLLKPLKEGWLKRERDRLDAEKKVAEEVALKALQEAEDARKVQAAAIAPTVEAALAVETAQAAADTALKGLDQAECAKPLVKGDLSFRASGLRTHWSAEVTDWKLAGSWYLQYASVREAIQQLANADARTQKAALNVPGVKPVSVEKV